MSKINLVIPMAGKSQRFMDAGYRVPKALLKMGNKNMIQSVVDNLSDLNTVVTLVINENQIQKSEINVSNANIVSLSYTPRGPALTAMSSLKHIDMDLPLMVANCDQIIEDFNMKLFLRFCNYHNLDGCLGAFHSNSPKNSYMRVDSHNNVSEVREKEVISSIATNGLHYWKNSHIFKESVDEMVKNNDTVNGEFYIAPSFNYLINNDMKVMPFWFNLHFPIGIPDDFEKYVGEIS